MSSGGRRTAIRAAAAIACGLLAGAAGARSNADAFDIFVTYRPSLLKIETAGGPDALCRSVGTGFIIGHDEESYLIATAAHVIPTAQECQGVMEIIGRPAMAEGITASLTLVHRSPRDIAVLRVARSNYPSPCRIQFGTPAAPVQRLLYMGYFDTDNQPLPYEGNIETPIVEDRQRITGSVNPGLSGGPVVDLEGNLIGMMRERVEADSAGNEIVGKGYITPVSILREELAILNLTELPLRPACYSELPELVVWNPHDPEPPSLTLPLSLSEVNDTHVNAPNRDIFRWLAERATGGNPPSLRYPRVFERRYQAREGYRFTGVVDTRILSRNRPSEPIPTTQCATADDCIRMSPDGTELIVRYRLWSGPMQDRTRGWLDMVLMAEQVRQPAGR